jgi:hypothetical protein
MYPTNGICCWVPVVCVHHITCVVTGDLLQVQVHPLIPVLHNMLSTCLKKIRALPDFDRYLAVLRQACRAIALKSIPFHRNLIDHLVDSGIVSDLMNLLFDILEGPNCSCKLQDHVVQLLLQLPCHLSDLIKLSVLSRLTKPLLLAFQSKSQDVNTLAFSVLELWTDSLNPSFLEPRMQVCAL